MEFVLLLFLLILAIREERKGRHRRTDTEILRSIPSQQHVRKSLASVTRLPVSSELGGASLKEAVSAGSETEETKDVVGQAA